MASDDPDLTKVEALCAEIIGVIQKHTEMSASVRVEASLLVLNAMIVRSGDTETSELFQECLDRFRAEVNKLRSGERKKIRPN